jgi:hypothetical protein
MKDSLGLQTHSVYPEPQFEYLFGNEVVTFHKNWTSNEVLKLEYYKNRPEMYYIKTHELPYLDDDSKAIYVLRDGRDSVSAVSHFWKMPVRHIICGIDNRFGGLSQHYYSWNPIKRKNTIVIRFEDMVENPNGVVDDLVDFLGVEKIADYVDDFEENKKKWPQLFNDRIGCYERIMKTADMELFDKCHGQFMREVGYYE